MQQTFRNTHTQSVIHAQAMNQDHMNTFGGCAGFARFVRDLADHTDEYLWVCVRFVTFVRALAN